MGRVVRAKRVYDGSGWREGGLEGKILKDGWGRDRDLEKGGGEKY